MERYCLRRNWMTGRCKVKTLTGHTQGDQSFYLNFYFLSFSLSLRALRYRELKIHTQNRSVTMLYRNGARINLYPNIENFANKYPQTVYNNILYCVATTMETLKRADYRQPVSQTPVFIVDLHWISLIHCFLQILYRNFSNLIRPKK